MSSRQDAIRTSGTPAGKCTPGIYPKKPQDAGNASRTAAQKMEAAMKQTFACAALLVVAWILLAGCVIPHEDPIPHKEELTLEAEVICVPPDTAAGIVCGYDGLVYRPLGVVK